MADSEILDTEAIETRPVHSPGMAIATLNPSDASPAGLALMKQRVETQKEMLKVAIQLTSPSQWTVFSGRGPNGEVRETIYPTGGAADTILRRVFGLTWGEKVVTIEDTETGPEAVCRAWLMHNGVQVEPFEGRRRMGGYIKTEADMRKGSVENMKSCALRDLLGLRFRTPSEMREMGLDVTKLERRAEFQDHGDAPVDSRAVLAPFGRSKGKPITDIDDNDLAWLTKAIGESVADPEKAKFKAKNQKLLDALVAEGKRRTGPAPAPAKTEAKPAEKKRVEDNVDDSKWANVGPPPLSDEDFHG